MKLLWAGPRFLHPTYSGGQIRTLEMLRELHRRHEVHYVALANPEEPEGPQRAAEYSTQSFPIEFRPVSKQSASFALQVIEGLLSPLPLAIGRWKSEAQRAKIAQLMREQSYDATVCDFLVTAVNFPDLERAVLFQHNVESIIWKRHAETARGLKKQLFALQERRMRQFEADACRQAAGVIAVSEKDAQTMCDLYGVGSSWVPTGVNLDYFRPPVPKPEPNGLVFVGSMDWMPNIDGIHWFRSEVLPQIRARRRDLPVTIVGRKPTPEIQALADSDPYLKVTGTVPDVRPYLWGAALSIVPLRIGGGTRLKIYESMAAGVPVLSTSVGAEGLDFADGETIAIADTPDAFARRCLDLIEDPAQLDRIGRNALQMVADRYSWDRISRQFEELLIKTGS